VENLTAFQVCWFLFIVYACELNFILFFTVAVLRRAVHPLLLPLLCTQSCVLGFKIVFHVYIHLSSVCGVVLQAVAISAAEIIVWTVLLLWAEKVMMNHLQHS